MTTDLLSKLYHKLLAEKKISSRADFARKVSNAGYEIGRAYMQQVLAGDKPVSAELSAAVYNVYYGDLEALKQESNPSLAKEPDYTRMVVETHAALMTTQAQLSDSHTAIMHLVQRVDVIAETSTKAADLAQKAVDGVNSLAGVLQNLKGNIESAGDVQAALHAWLGENLDKFLGRDSIVIAGEIGQLADEARKLRERNTGHESKRGITRGKARNPA